jgi:hypothetical protein
MLAEEQDNLELLDNMEDLLLQVVAVTVQQAVLEKLF